MNKIKVDGIKNVIEGTKLTIAPSYETNFFKRLWFKMFPKTSTLVVVAKDYNHNKDEFLEIEEIVGKL